MWQPTIASCSLESTQVQTHIGCFKHIREGLKAMLTAIMRLLDGDQQFTENCRRARDFWRDFLSTRENSSVAQLAEDLGRIQSRYERETFEERTLAKEMMALTCIGSLYDEVEDWSDDARKAFAIRVAKAFLSSSLSVEAKGSNALEAIQLYFLPDHDAELADAVASRRNRHAA
jgi:hypothetical protein